MLVLPLGWMWSAPCRLQLLPCSRGCISLEAGTRQLGRSLPLSGCLVCPGLEAIVICSGGGGKSAESVSHISSLQPFIWAVSCVNCEYYQSAAVISQQTRLVYRQFQRPVLARRVNLFHLQNWISAISGFTYELTGLFVLAGYFFTS